MGIPSYLKHIINKYPETHFWNDNIQVDNFYIDFNSIIYNVIPEVDIKLTYIDYENELISKIIKKLQYIICKVIKPEKMVYIAADGTVPRAKMIQQRFRRYKSIKEKNFIKDVEKKYGLQIPSSNWNKNSISPGTIFMSKLSREIINKIQSKYFNIYNDKLIIIYNDETIPGEGEHKILPNLKRNKNNEVSVIYSPDADLIILSIISDINNIFILRDVKDIDINNDKYKDFLYIDINACKNFFGKYIIYNLEDNNINENLKKFNINEKKIIIDYCFMTFLCGNDFVKAVPFLKIKDGGIDILIKIYRNLLIELQQYLIEDNYTINYIFLHYLIKELANIENVSMKKWQRKRDRIRKGVKPIKDFEEDMIKKEPWKLEILRFNHEEYYSPKHPLYEVFNKVFDKIDYYKEDWTNDYNKHFFDSDDINSVCYDYIKSLNFCLQYYFNNVPSWSWYYKYRNAPTMKDLSTYIEKLIDKMEDTDKIPINIEWNIGKPFEPFEHLMYILPKNSFNLLPKCLILDDLCSSKYYPINFKLDILHGNKFVYSEPILPDIPENYIHEKISSNQNNFSNIEKKRNTLRTKPYVFKGFKIK